MYHRIVRATVRSTFAKINRGDYTAMVDNLGEPFEYHFHGAHALGGRRTTRAAVVRWWERVERLLPGTTFDVQEVLVQGMPWRTRLAVRSIVTRNVPGQVRYATTNVQFMTLRWGRVTSIETFEDSTLLADALRAVVAAGDPEGGAEAITG